MKTQVEFSRALEVCIVESNCCQCYGVYIQTHADT